MYGITDTYTDAVPDGRAGGALPGLPFTALLQVEAHRPCFCMYAVPDGKAGGALPGPRPTALLQVEAHRPCFCMYGIYRT